MPSQHKCVVLILIAMILALAAPAMPQDTPQGATPDLPFHATNWTPMPQPAPPGPAPQAAPSAAIPLSQVSWTPIGPGPLSTTSSPNANFNVSGRIAAVAAHPTDPNTIYIAAAGGGVWKTTDGGTTWAPLTDTQPTLSMGAIAIATNNPFMIYAGTGEANNSGDSNHGFGILVTTDGGATWTLSTGPSGIFNTNRLTTSQIAVDPTNANVAYVAMAAFGANGVSGGTGIYKTADGGATWTNKTATIDSLNPWSSVAVDPNNTQSIYAAVGRTRGASTNGVYKSTDGGTSWSLLTNAPNGVTTGRFAIAVSKSNSSVVYVSISNPSTAAVHSVVQSNNGGATFAPVTPTNYMGSQGWYDTTIIVDPSNSAIVYVAGSAGANSILRSMNSGVSWTDISGGGAPNFNSPHPDHHGAAFDANGKFLDGDDGGIYRLDDPTVPSWSDLNGNLETIQFQGVGLHPTDPNKAIGGSQDNGTEIFGGSVIWAETDGGDGGFAKFSPTNGLRAYHQIPVVSFGSNFFRRSDDGGNTWTTYTNSIVADKSFQNFYAPFVVDPGNGDRVLYGTHNVWETINGGAAWTALSTVGTAGWNPSGFNVDAIGLARSDTNTIYAAASGHIFGTINHGVSWTEHSISGNARVADLQVDPASATTVYAVINRFNAAGTVFRTTNGGANWTSITGNLPIEPVWSLQIDPSGVLYVGTDDGVYATSNGGTTWSRFGTGLPNAQVFQLDLNSSEQILAAATHGRSAWEISTGGPIVALVSSLNPSAVGQPVTFTATLTGVGGTPTGTVTFLDGATSLGTGSLNGSGVATFTTSSLAVGSHSITASYGGDANFGVSTSKAIAQVVLNSSATAVASSLNPSVFGQSVTFTATVTSTGGTLTGTVTFFDGATSLGTGSLSAGIATFTTSALALGSHSITASYGGNTNIATSTSPAISQTVSVAGFAPVAAQTVVAGQSVVINLTAYSASGSMTFILSCEGLPSKSSCLFNPNPVTPGPLPNGTPIQLTFGTASSKLPARPSDRSPWPWGTLGISAVMAALLTMGLIQLRYTPQRRLAFGVCLAVVFLAAVLTGCGSSSGSSSPPYTGTPKGTSTFTVMGVSGATTISTQVSVTVQ